MTIHSMVLVNQVVKAAKKATKKRAKKIEKKLGCSGIGRKLTKATKQIMYVMSADPEKWRKDLKKENKKKGRGRPHKYPESLFEKLAMVQEYFDLTYRDLEGFALECYGKEFAPDHDTLQARISNMKVDTRKHIKLESAKITLAIDSSGLVQHAGGFWIEHKHHVEKKGFVKLHICIDVKTLKILEFSVTTDEVHDNSQLQKLVGDSIAQIKDYNDIEELLAELLADGAYDANDNHVFCKENNIINKIKVRISSVIGDCEERNKAVIAQLLNNKNMDLSELTKEQKLENRAKWKKRVGYGKRSLVETVFSMFKNLFGEHVRSRKWENIVQELRLRVATYNHLIDLAA